MNLTQDTTKTAASPSGLQRVTVLGTGVLGAQIAFQCAFHGKSVTAYDIDAAALERARDALTRLAQTYAADLPGTTPEATTRVAAAIALSSDLAQAVRDADLVIEAVPEKLELKRSVYAELARLAREGTIFATNSSTLLPSAFADATGRPEKFLALHFANHIWRQNTAEVMGTPQTDPEVFEQVARFAAEIGMEPIRLHKEQPGYVLNSLLVPLLNAAAALLLKGVASPEDIDKTWRIGTGAKLGPFQIYDIVGLRTAYNIASANPATQGWAEYLKVNYIDKGRLGAGAGGGFYDD